MVSTKGLDKAEVLCALYNASKVQGMGFLQATGKPMMVSEAAKILETITDFDYLYGKVMKIDLRSDEGFEEWLYDRDNGPGAAQKVIDRLNVDKALAYYEGETPILIYQPTVEVSAGPAASGCEASYLEN